MSKSFTIHPGKSALLVMDYQNMLLNNYLSADEAASVLGRTAELISSARKNRMQIIYVMVAFRHGHPEVSARNKIFSLLKNNGLFARGGDDTSIHSAVAPANEDPIVIKHRVGAFSGTDLDTLLRANGIETLVLAGITTSGVVLSTVRQAFDQDYRLVVAHDCCADPDQEVHRILLEKIIAEHAYVATAQEIIKASQS